jgi:hypothetical protein
MPPDPPEPADLHARFNDLDWGDHLPSAAEIAKIHGTKATVKSLQMLEQAVNAEPRITADFLAALPPNCSPYKLASRVKSPESLARKLRDAELQTRRSPVEDLYRYTVLTESPHELVEAADHTVEELGHAGWKVEYAMQSYTDGSRYKGIHAYLATAEGEHVEVQFHSTDSVKVKEATTRWYEIERREHASPADRAAARQKCVDLSAPLVQPRGIDNLDMLGGRRVAVNNYSDSRRRSASAPASAKGPKSGTQARQLPTRQMNDGINR